MRKRLLYHEDKIEALLALLIAAIRYSTEIQAGRSDPATTDRFVYDLRAVENAADDIVNGDREYL